MALTRDDFINMCRQIGDTALKEQLKETPILRDVATAASKATGLPYIACYVVVSGVVEGAARGIDSLPPKTKQALVDRVFAIPGASLVLGNLKKKIDTAIQRKLTDEALRRVLVDGNDSGLEDVPLPALVSTDAAFMLRQLQESKKQQKYRDETIAYFETLQRSLLSEPPLMLDLAGHDRLHFRSRAWGLFGRDAELMWLDNFLYDRVGAAEQAFQSVAGAPTGSDARSVRGFSWALLYGPGGSGKSRLALEFLLNKSGGWRSGFLRIHRADMARFSTWRPQRPTVMAVDYASLEAEALGKFMECLAASAPEFDFPVRLLLIEQSRSFERDMLIGKGGATQKNLLLACQYAGSPWRLEPLQDNDLWRIVEAQVPQKESAKLARFDQSDMLGRFRTADHEARPLFAAFMGSAIADGRDPFAGGMIGQVRNMLERQDHMYWRNKGVDEKDRRLAALATVCQGIPLSALKELPVRFPTDNEFSGRAERIASIVGPLRGTAGETGGRTIPQLEPDLLGELFALDQFDTGADEFGHAREDLLRAWSIAPRRTSEFFTRAMRNFSRHPTLNWMLTNPPASAEGRREHLRALQRVAAEIAPKAPRESTEAVDVGPPDWETFWPVPLEQIRKLREATAAEGDLVAAHKAFSEQIITFFEIARSGWCEAATDAAVNEMVAHTRQLVSETATWDPESLYTFIATYHDALLRAGKREAADRFLDEVDRLTDNPARRTDRVFAFATRVADLEEGWLDHRTAEILPKLKAAWRRAAPGADEVISQADWVDLLDIVPRYIRVLFARTSPAEARTESDACEDLVLSTLAKVELEDESTRPDLAAMVKEAMDDVFVGLPVATTDAMYDLLEDGPVRPMPEVMADHKIWVNASFPLRLSWEDVSKRSFAEYRKHFRQFCEGDIERVRVARLTHYQKLDRTADYVAAEGEEIVGDWVVKRVFGEGFGIIRVNFREQASGRRCYATLLTGPHSTYALDGTNGPVYDFFDKNGFRVSSPEEAIAWAKCFFAFVHGRHGAFRLIEDMSDLPLTKPLPDDIARVARATFRPIEFLGMDGENFIIRAGILFHNAIFRSNIRVAPTGIAEIFDQSLLVEQVPIIADPFWERERKRLGFIIPYEWPKPEHDEDWRNGTPHLHQVDVADAIDNAMSGGGRRPPAGAQQFSIDISALGLAPEVIERMLNNAMRDSNGDHKAFVASLRRRLEGWNVKRSAIDAFVAALPPPDA